MRYAGLIAVLLFVVTGVAVVLAKANLQGSADDEGLARALPQQIVLEAETVPALYPHEHSLENSVFDEEHGIWKFSPTETLEQDVWVTKFELVLENAPMTSLHHAGITNLNEPNQVCPNSPHEVYRHEIFSTTPDMAEAPVEFPEGYGLFLPKGSRLVLVTMLHNPLPPYGPGEVYTEVAAKVVLNVEPASTASMRPVEYYRLHIDDVACPGAVYQEVFTVPAGAQGFVKRGTERDGMHPARVELSRSGELIYATAHLHPWEGGEKLDVLVKDKNVATFRPRQLSNEAWSWIIPHQKSGLPRVRAGDTLSIEATYSNPYGGDISGAMGMFVFYFAPDP
ncbi:MAG: hypothetical protein WD850_00675 [Candidatus Spechtbacterales bacterium]